MGGLVAKLNLVTPVFPGFLTYPFGICVEENKAVGTALFHRSKFGMNLWQVILL